MVTRSFTFGPLLHQTLGYDNFFDSVEKLLDNDVKQNSFPHHNIFRKGESNYIVELAVAGFSREEIDIEVTGGEMKIIGYKTEEKDEGRTWLHRGIATRSFTKTITISDTIEVKGADLKNGILVIELENIVPEHKKPRKIAIGSTLKPELLQEDTVS